MIPSTRTRVVLERKEQTCSFAHLLANRRTTPHGGKVAKEMLAVRALYHDGKLEWLEPPPEDAQGMVAVVFLEAEQVQDADKREADMLAASPNFRRLMERSMAYLADEETRPVQALLDELPD
jgi:hypothetical protein